MREKAITVCLHEHKQCCGFFATNSATLFIGRSITIMEKSLNDWIGQVREREGAQVARRAGMPIISQCRHSMAVRQPVDNRLRCVALRLPVCLFRCQSSIQRLLRSFDWSRSTVLIFVGNCTESVENGCSSIFAAPTIVSYDREQLKPASAPRTLQIISNSL